MLYAIIIAVSFFGGFFLGFGANRPVALEPLPAVAENKSATSTDREKELLRQIAASNCTPPRPSAPTAPIQAQAVPEPVYPEVDVDLRDRSIASEYQEDSSGRPYIEDERRWEREEDMPDDYRER